MIPQREARSANHIGRGLVSGSPAGGNGACQRALILATQMAKSLHSRPRRWRGVPLGGKLQRGARWCLYSPEIEAKTHVIGAWMRPELGSKPTRAQLVANEAALRSIGAKRLRREGREWIWRLPELSKK